MVVECCTVVHRTQLSAVADKSDGWNVTAKGQAGGQFLRTAFIKGMKVDNEEATVESNNGLPGSARTQCQEAGGV